MLLTQITEVHAFASSTAPAATSGGGRLVPDRLPQRYDTQKSHVGRAFLACDDHDRGSRWV